MTEIDYDSIDFFRSESLLDDPYPYFDHLRSQCPVHREPHHDVVMVTGYEESKAVYSDAERFSACNTVSGPFPGFPVPLEGDDVSELIETYRDQLPLSDEIMTMDPPRHTAYRALLMRYLTPKRMKETEPFMVRLADQLIDGFVESASCDFFTDFAQPFTLLNVCELLGVPESDHESFIEAFLGPRRGSTLGSTDATRPDDHYSWLHVKFTTYIEERREEPRDDVLTSLATRPFPDGSMPEVIDSVRLASVLFGAGAGTTAQFLTGALRLLAERPDLQRQLRGERERIPNFVEEMLRFDGPVKGDFRLSRVPTTVGGVEIPAGSTVMLVNEAANRDPRKFECPDEFRLDRENARQHVAFGHGIHLCAGAALARAEGRVGIDRVLERLEDIKISEAAHGPVEARRYEYVPSYMLHGVNGLHLEFAPA
jgi:cytochrome P450